MKSKTIAILGGMGPEASVYLYKLLIEKAIKEFGARNNDEFPEILLYSIPVPDFISSNEKRQKALRMLKKRVNALNAIDISCIGIACNTAHVLLKDLQEVSKAPFVSMIDEVALVVERDKLKTVGILGTPSTLRERLYETALEKNRLSSVAADEKAYPLLERAIRNVIAGETSSFDQKQLLKIADHLKKQGAEGIILGCTELPLVFPSRYSLPVYNSVAILATALLRRYYK